MAKTGKRRPTDAPNSVVHVDPYSHDSTAAAVEQLTALVEAQARTIRDYQAAMTRGRDIFERASAAARLGLWECDLGSERLQWSGGTYDMFGIQRERPLVRGQALIRYPVHSLKTLETIRSRAINERAGFNLDTDIVTPAGERRWIRITATVECTGDRPTRLFGFKQDITEEKKRWERTRYLAEFDELTGLANRNQFQVRLAEACGDDTGLNAGGTLLLIDLDAFKEVNDSLGHAAGDECLKEASQRLARACAMTKVIARLGGDEFAVLLDAREGVGSAMLLAKQVVAALQRPIWCGKRRVRVGASIGLAIIRGCRSTEVLKRADIALYAAKAAGGNTARWFDARRMRL
jgi:diguanylate cyclase (GGDEF)-like protein